RRRGSLRLLRPAARVRARAHSRATLCGVQPYRAHLDHPPHRQRDLESMAAAIGAEGCRRAELRALRRKIRSRHGQWRARDLGAGEGLGIVPSATNCTAPRNAALRRGAVRACLASRTDFAITAATKMLRVGARQKSARSQKSREDFSWPISAF